MKNIILILTFATLITGCRAGANYQQISAATGYDKAIIEKYCKGISCHLDELKGNLQATASDSNTFLSMTGHESRAIEYNWVTGWKNISIDLFSVNLYDNWSGYNKVEVYVGKEMVATVSSKSSMTIGYYNEYARKVEKIERVSGYISFEQAKKIALSHYSQVTLRFYSSDGYNDIKLQREHSLIQVVNIAMLSNR